MVCFYRLGKGINSFHRDKSIPAIKAIKWLGGELKAEHKIKKRRSEEKNVDSVVEGTGTL